MSKLREWARQVGRDVYAAHPVESAVIERAEALMETLQSFPVALGTSPEDHRRGIVRFGGRYYYPENTDQASVIRDAQVAYQRITDAVLDRCASAGVKAKIGEGAAPGRVPIRPRRATEGENKPQRGASGPRM